MEATVTFAGTIPLPAGAPLKRAGPCRLAPNLLASTDWHNEYAQFVLDLQQTLYKSSNDTGRYALLRRLRKALKA
jgi:hypothetical protein